MQPSLVNARGGKTWRRKTNQRTPQLSTFLLSTGTRLKPPQELNCMMIAIAFSRCKSTVRGKFRTRLGEPPRLRIPLCTTTQRTGTTVLNTIFDPSIAKFCSLDLVRVWFEAIRTVSSLCSTLGSALGFFRDD